MKKLISLALVLIMTLSFVLPASAADDTLTDAQLVAAVEAAATAFVEGKKVEVSDALVAAVAEEADTPEEVANFFSKFVFVKDSEIEAVSQKIADSCKYTITTVDDGRKTIYVAVDLRKSKEIFDARVFLNATKKVFDKCKELAIADGMMEGDGLYTLMSYNHLAGELALHMIIADLTNDLGASKGNGILKDLFNKSVVSDLNVDEDRLAPALIEFFGQTVVFFLNTFFVTFKK
jgi:hypothetical protein